MEYLIAWLEPDNGTRFRARVVLAESVTEAMYELLKKVNPETLFNKDCSYSELEEALVEASERGSSTPLLVFNILSCATLFSMEDY